MHPTKPLVALTLPRGPRDFLTARSLIESGRLGELVRWESRFERWRPQVADSWREGAGLLLDLGSHLVDQVIVALGPVASVYAEVDTRRSGATADDDVQVSLTHVSGVRSLLSTSSLASQRGPRFRLVGTEASWVKHGLDVQEALLRYGRMEVEDGGRLGTDEASTQLEPRPGEWGQFNVGVEAALRTGTAMPVTGAEALEVLRVLDAARASSVNGQIVHLR